MGGFVYYVLNNKPFFEAETSVCLDKKTFKKRTKQSAVLNVFSKNAKHSLNILVYMMVIQY